MFLFGSPMSSCPLGCVRKQLTRAAREIALTALGHDAYNAPRVYLQYPAILQVGCGMDRDDRCPAAAGAPAVYVPCICIVMSCVVSVCVMWYVGRYKMSRRYR